MNRQENLGLAGITPARAKTAIGGDVQVFTDMSLIESLIHAVLKQHEPGQRPNGTGSVNAGYTGGEMITKPITFTGRRLVLNYATLAAGSIRVEIQDASGQALPGFGLEDCQAVIGDAIERQVRWKNNPDLAAIAGKPVRLRFALRECDLYSFRFHSK